ncbi:Trp biosynthesis-associated membrane protein [Jiangella gansuensis]|uniref:Trp biosynthesis-associated membrane protein n=1 Tax=Jiangella gansuensis TaxID=281473 RepID=UPI0004B93C5F|nr:Trp biosynthesis-associated membrane protein [Jiangella gansuensis]
MNASRREYLLTLALLAAGGLLGLAASSRPWGSARQPSSLSTTVTTVSGSDLLPYAPAVSLVAVAAVVAVPAVRRIGRQIVGAVLAVLGVTLVVSALLAVLDLADRIETWMGDSPGTAGPVTDVTTSPAWGIAVLVAGVMVLTAGVLTAVRGPGWPGMGAKYERPARRDTADGEGGASSRDTWDALDRGDDPT